MNDSEIRRSLVSMFGASLLMPALSTPSVTLAKDFKPREIRLGYALSETSNQGRAAKVMADSLEKASGGQIKTRTVGLAALGSDIQMWQALVAGTQELCVVSTATLLSLVKEMALWDTPFLFNNSREADAILDGPIGQRIMAKLQDKGLVGLVYWENGFRNLTNSKRPIARMEDLDGVKLRVMQNNVYLESFKILGANAVPMPFNDLLVALEAKTVDGQENPFNTILSSKLYETQSYLSISNHTYSPWILLASKKWWDGLSTDEKKAVSEAAKVSRDFERKDSREESAKALKELKAKGMQINEISPIEINRMRNRLTRVNATLAANVGMDLWLETQTALYKLRGIK